MYYKCNAGTVRPLHLFPMTPRRPPDEIEPAAWAAACLAMMPGMGPMTPRQVREGGVLLLHPSSSMLVVACVRGGCARSRPCVAQPASCMGSSSDGAGPSGQWLHLLGLRMLLSLFEAAVHRRLALLSDQMSNNAYVAAHHKAERTFLSPLPLASPH